MKKILIIGLLLLLPLFSAWAQPIKALNVGSITQVHNRVTFLDYADSKVHEVRPKSTLLTEGSYLIGDDAYMTAKILDGGFLRANPNTKFVLEFDVKTKYLTVNLLTGSIKSVISQKLSKGEVQKLYFKSAEVLAEASEAKFSVTRTPMLDVLSFHVEKGAVTVTKGDSMVIVHALESVSISDKVQGIETPRKISEKELKFLQGRSYLKDLPKKSKDD